MEISKVVECHVEPQVGMPVKHDRYGECDRKYSVEVGTIIKVDYLGNYNYKLTCEIDMDKVGFPFNEPNCIHSIFVTNPSVLTNEYADEMAAVNIN